MFSGVFRKSSRGTTTRGPPSYLKGARSEGRNRSPRSSKTPPGRFFLLNVFGTPPSINVVYLFRIQHAKMHRTPSQRSMASSILRPIEGAVAQKYFLHRGRRPSGRAPSAPRGGDMSQCSPTTKYASVCVCNSLLCCKIFTAGMFPKHSEYIRKFSRHIWLESRFNISFNPGPCKAVFIKRTCRGRSPPPHRAFRN